MGVLAAKNGNRKGYEQELNTLCVMGALDSFDFLEKYVLGQGMLHEKKEKGVFSFWPF